VNRSRVISGLPALPKSATLHVPRSPLRELLDDLLACEPEHALGAVLFRVPSALPLPASLDVRARWMLAYVDGARTVEEMLEHCGLPRKDAIVGICELVARHIVQAP
jgi:hypothetical protein